jgi:hypothetical protein
MSLHLILNYSRDLAPLCGTMSLHLILNYSRDLAPLCGTMSLHLILNYSRDLVKKSVCSIAATDAVREHNLRLFDQHHLFRQHRVSGLEFIEINSTRNILSVEWDRVCSGVLCFVDQRRDLIP